jgi:hypothetical protein
MSPSIYRLLLLAFSITAAVACEEVSPSQITNADIENVTNWTPAGVLAYVGPSAFQTYNDRGPELLNAAYGGPIDISLPSLKKVVRLAPIRLKVWLLEGGQGIALTARFESNFVIEITEQCTLSWSPGAVEIAFQLDFDFDNASITSDNDENYKVTISESDFQFDNPCDDTTWNALHAEYSTAVNEAFSHPEVMTRLAKAMMGGDKSYAISINEKVDILTAPNLSTSTDSITQGVLIRPSNVAVHHSLSSCFLGKDADLAKSYPSVTLPAPTIDLQENTSDWVFAWRLDLLKHTVSAMTSSGVFCRYDGLAGLPSVTDNTYLADDFDVLLPSYIPRNTPLAWSIEPMDVPTVLVDSDGNIDLEFPMVRLRLFIIRWSMPHLVDEYEGAVRLQHATLQLRNRVVAIAGGSWSTDNELPYWDSLLTAVTQQKSAVIPLGTVQGNFPFRSVIQNVSQTEHHLLAWCQFDKESPPVFEDLSTASGSIQIDDQANHSPAAAACSIRIVSYSASTPWLVLLLLALTGLRLRVIVPIPEETSP